jgi:hypothetical protein
VTRLVVGNELFLCHIPTIHKATEWARHGIEFDNPKEIKEFAARKVREMDMYNIVFAIKARRGERKKEEIDSLTDTG